MRSFIHYVSIFLKGFLIGCFIGMALIATQVHADEETVWLTSGMWSRHNQESKYHYRQNNTGLGVQVDQSQNMSIVFGYYNNSIYRQTVYGGLTYTPFHFGSAKTGIMAAMATGYTQYIPAVPIMGLYGTYEFKKFGINVVWLPSVVAAIQLKFKLEEK